MVNVQGCHLCGTWFDPHALRTDAAAETAWTHECDRDVVARFAFRAITHAVRVVTGRALTWDMLNDRPRVAAAIRRYRALSIEDRNESKRAERVRIGLEKAGG